MKTTLIIALLLGLTCIAQAHEHKPPHEGTLVVFGKELAHLEFVLDAENGKLTAYALDGEAEYPVRIMQKYIDVSITPQGSKESFALRLVAMGNVLTGELPGDTSQFEGESDKLKGVSDFEGVVSKVKLRGHEFKKTEFNYPKGNE